MSDRKPLISDAFEAKNVGASRDEVISAILVGLPAAGNVVTQVLPTALRTYDGGQDVDPR